ncbi:Uncharacterised protein [Kluyvera cryocrescens]|uniref:Uncharacterized protein n=1 Tax=Kluyvera cryocrescens TaxID=580 RepID=A0A485CTP0_KLUCR|nr:Uncharacterised protein [Kluyvera cryocrescens]
MPTVSITTPAREPNAAGTPYSSIASVKASSIPAASAGESIGSVTCQNACPLFAPCTRATVASKLSARQQAARDRKVDHREDIQRHHQHNAQAG